MTKKVPKTLKKYKWSKKKSDVALAMSRGIFTQRDIAEQFNISETSISIWKRDPEFLERVDVLTIANENATRAGLLREAYIGLDIKRNNIVEDKSTHLDYMKEISDLQALKKQLVELSGNVKLYEFSTDKYPDPIIEDTAQDNE